ncbi:hypothetical protein AYO44_15445 [Planctomycetaceae bacterium SCGC AG-212-F19]|nr:hypothetical protein AYO44_15445 [Planctomycetaceae bacterium SCGC AG-212-F19]
MPISFQCPKCKKEQRANDHLEGRELKCAKCGGLFKVPKVGTGNPPARFVDELYSGPKKAAPAPVAKPVPAGGAPAPVAIPLPAGPKPGAPAPAVPSPAAAFEQDLILTDDMLVDAPAKPGKPGAAAEPVLELTEEMIVEEGAPKGAAAASPEELELLDEIVMEEASPPAKPPKKK